jgi:colicin import membrane protein
MNTLPSKIEEQVKASGLELSEAQTIAGQYAPLMSEIAEIEAVVKTLETGKAADLEKAKRARIDLGKICSRAERQKQSDKEKVLVRGRFIDGLYNTVNGYGRLTQESAKEIEDYAERIEAERKAKLKAERLASLEPFGVPEPLGLAEMTEDVFANYLTGVETAHRLRIEAEAKAKAEAEAAAEAERQRIAEQAAENARLKAEAEARERELAAERAKVEAERKAAQDAADKARLEAEAKAAKERAELEAKLRAEAEAKAKVEAELQAKKDAEAKAEADRIAAEKKAEAERIKAAKAPIKVKLNAWVDSFTLPDTDVDNATAHVIREKFNAFKAWAKTQVENV